MDNQLGLMDNQLGLTGLNNYCTCVLCPYCGKPKNQFPPIQSIQWSGNYPLATSDKTNVINCQGKELK
jgi:hypothetical protein